VGIRICDDDDDDDDDDDVVSFSMYLLSSVFEWLVLVLGSDLLNQYYYPSSSLLL